MLSRRSFLVTSAGAAISPLAAQRALAQLIGRGAFEAIPPAPHIHKDAPFHYFVNTDESIFVDGVPFAPGMTGDFFATGDPDQHPHFPILGEWIGYGNDPPAPTESADVVVIGGGVSGLMSAYLLREHNPIVLEFSNHFGGAAQAEVWRGVPYSLGGAYVIEPDEPLASLYKELGIDQNVRISYGDPVEANGVIHENFYSGEGSPAEEAPAFAKFAALVQQMGEDYPSIPLLKDPKEREWVEYLDQMTFKEHIESEMGGPLPPLLEAAVQYYCYSSFCAGYEELSAASAWNFFAAEQFGQWVWPGGNATLANVLYERVLEATGRRNMRSQAVALDVRLNPGGAQVTYLDNQKNIRSIQAKKVVISAPKFVADKLLGDWVANNDQERLTAFSQLNYRAYAVANILLNVDVPDQFYDLFYLQDGEIPAEDKIDPSVWNRPLDAVSAGYPFKGLSDRSVLTVYWPMPFDGGRFLMLFEESFDYLTNTALPHIDYLMNVLGLDRSHIEQVRLTKWGHALPIARPNFIADGHAEAVRAPIEDTIYFVQQDNWALPAVENSLLDAYEYAPQIAAALNKP